MTVQCGLVKSRLQSYCYMGKKIKASNVLPKFGYLTAPCILFAALRIKIPTKHAADLQGLLRLWFIDKAEIPLSHTSQQAPQLADFKAVYGDDLRDRNHEEPHAGH
jgi:hypothetical protein